MACLSIGDDGIGLPQAVDAGAKTTFGLKLVQTLTDQLRGSLEIQRGSGTMFHIRFPAAAQADVLVEGRSVMKNRVFVVEDDNIIGLGLERGLARMDYEVAGRVASGEEAVARAETLRPDIILMDIRLKGAIDGIEAAKQIRSRLDVPVVYLTSYSDQETLDRARSPDPTATSSSLTRTASCSLSSRSARQAPHGPPVAAVAKDGGGRPAGGRRGP